MKLNLTIFLSRETNLSGPLVHKLFSNTVWFRFRGDFSIARSKTSSISQSKKLNGITKII